MGKLKLSRKKEIEYLLKLEAHHDEKIVNRYLYIKLKNHPSINHPLINMIKGKIHTFCGKLTRNHTFYVNKILENGGYISYGGENPQIVIIPSYKTLKDMKKNKKFFHIQRHNPTIIKEDVLCTILNINYPIKDADYYTDTE